MMSVRADRLVRSARHVAFFRKAGKLGQARQIVADLLPDTAVEFAMEYPVTTEIPLSDPRYHQILSAFYDECCQHIRALIQAGEDVIVLCEGDPFFYGSFMHIYDRLRTDCPAEVVPAWTEMMRRIQFLFRNCLLASLLSPSAPFMRLRCPSWRKLSGRPWPGPLRMSKPHRPRLGPRMCRWVHPRS